MSTGACRFKESGVLVSFATIKLENKPQFQKMSQEAEVVTPGFSISNLLGLEKLNMAKAGEIGDKKILLEKTDDILHSGK